MNRGLTQALTGKRLAMAQRRLKVAANILAGATFADVAQTLNVSKATVSKDYHAILDDWKALYADKADQYLQLIMRRLDVLLNAIWEDARQGDNMAKLDRALAIIDRQAALVQRTKGGLTGRGVVLFEISEGMPALPAPMDVDELDD